MTKPNILIIICDQLAQRAVGCYDNHHVKSPTIDSLAASGTKFTKAYTPCPLCMPARGAFWTGTLPHDTWTVSNEDQFVNRPVTAATPTLGSIFSGAGYATVHFGKRHDNHSLRGFYCEPESSVKLDAHEAWPVNYDSERDEYTTQKCEEYLTEKTSGDKPFLMVADLQNPHDICSWIGTFRGQHEDVAPPEKLPPLPENFSFDDIENRPLPVQYICCSHNRQAQTAEWTDTNFQHYLSAYYHYISRVDTQIARIIKALKKSGQYDNTLIVFMADHGDGMTAHQMVTKQVSFYDETACVPLIFSGCGINNAAQCDKLVSLSDLLPTLCDFAGLDKPKDIYGKSFLPQLKKSNNAQSRQYVVSEWMTEWGYTISPGRMLRSEKFKYTRYLEGDGEELFDMENDPGENTSLVNDPAYKDILSQHREMLAQHITDADDPFWHLKVKADSQWRSHKSGYHNHKGPAAPEHHRNLRQTR